MIHQLTVVHLEADCARQRRRIFARIRIRHRAQRGLIIGHRRRAGKRQYAGAGIVGASDAVLRGKPEHVLRAGEVGGKGNRRAREVGAVGIRDRQAGGDRRRCLILEVRDNGDLGIDHRSIVHCADVHRGRHDIAGVIQGLTVVHLVTDRTRQHRRIRAGVGIRHRAQRRLIIGHGRRADKGEHAGAGVIKAENVVLIRKPEHVLPGGEVAGDGYRRARQARAVHIGDSQHGINRRRRLVLGVAQCAAIRRQHRRVVHRCDSHRQRFRQRVDPAVGHSTRVLHGPRERRRAAAAVGRRPELHALQLREGVRRRAGITHRSCNVHLCRARSIGRKRGDFSSSEVEDLHQAHRSPTRAGQNVDVSGLRHHPDRHLAGVTGSKGGKLRELSCTGAVEDPDLPSAPHHDLRLAIPVEITPGYKNAAREGGLKSQEAGKQSLIRGAEHSHDGGTPETETDNDVGRAITIHITAAHAHPSGKSRIIHKKLTQHCAITSTENTHLRTTAGAGTDNDVGPAVAIHIPGRDENSTRERGAESKITRQLRRAASCQAKNIDQGTATRARPRHDVRHAIAVNISHRDSRTAKKRRTESIEGGRASGTEPRIVIHQWGEPGTGAGDERRGDWRTQGGHDRHAVGEHDVAQRRRRHRGHLEGEHLTRFVGAAARAVGECAKSERRGRGILGHRQIGNRARRPHRRVVHRGDRHGQRFR